LSALAAALQTEPGVLWAAPEEFGVSAMTALRETYSLAGQVRAVVWAKSLEEAESLLTLGTAPVAVVPALEEAVTQSGFVALADDRGALPSEALAVTAQRDLVVAHPDIASLLAQLTPHLTPTAIHELIITTRRDPATMADVAREFLAREGLRPRE